MVNFFFLYANFIKRNTIGTLTHNNNKHNEEASNKNNDVDTLILSPMICGVLAKYNYKLSFGT